MTALTSGSEPEVISDLSLADETNSKTAGPKWGSAQPKEVIVQDQAWLQGQIAIGKKLGEGKFGAVFQGTFQGSEVACKKMNSGDAAHRELLRECAALIACTTSYHEHVMQLHGLWKDVEGSSYIVTEFCSGGSLKEFIKQHDDPQDLSTGDFRRKAKEWATQITAGMIHIVDAGFVHRDLRCDNILLKDEGGSGIKIGDLGLTRPAQPGKPFSWGTDEKTPKPWYPPEAVNSFHFHLEASDMWSFGCVLFEIFSRCKWPPWFNEAPGGTASEKAKNWVASAKVNICNPETQLQRPFECPEAWWPLATKAMAFDFLARPTFADMNQEFRDLELPEDSEGAAKPIETVTFTDLGESTAATGGIEYD
jgi:serine/threonine protein kinase